MASTVAEVILIVIESFYSFGCAILLLTIFT